MVTRHHCHFGSNALVPHRSPVPLLATCASVAFSCPKSHTWTPFFALPHCVHASNPVFAAHRFAQRRRWLLPTALEAPRPSASITNMPKRENPSKTAAQPAAPTSQPSKQKRGAGGHGDDEAFPRGGASALTPLEARQVQEAARAEFEQEQAAAASGKPAKKAKHGKVRYEWQPGECCSAMGGTAAIAACSSALACCMRATPAAVTPAPVG